MSTELTDEALKGYRSSIFDSCPFYASSDSAAAWQIGRWMRLPDQGAPQSVKASRGYSYRVDGKLISVRWNGDAVAIKRIG